MNHLSIHPDILFNPEAILDSFRNQYSLTEVKERLAEWQEVAFTTDNMLFDDCISRQELARFSAALNNVAEAIWAMKCGRLKNR